MPGNAARGESARVAIPLAMLLAMLAGCGGNNNNNNPNNPPSSGETISGRERIGWDQAASSATELATFRYAIYVDGNRVELTDVNCATTATAAGFPCSARLPTLSPGSHTLEIAAFVIESGQPVESARSAQLRVTVTGATAAVAAAIQAGDVIATDDGVSLRLERVADTPAPANDIAVTDDGRMFVADADGRIRVTAGDELTDVLELPETRSVGGIISLALSPDFAGSGHLFVAHATASDERTVAFRVSRYRYSDRGLVDRMVVLPDIAASTTPNAELRFGPDGRLYAAFDNAGDQARAARLSDWSGKLLRVNSDGRTPDDQPAASPVMWSGIAIPGGLGWSGDGKLLWMSEHAADGVERLRSIALSEGRSRHASERSVYVLPAPVGASSLTVHRGGTIPEFEGDLFLGARDGGYILRVRTDQNDPARASSSERLLEGRTGPVRAIHASAEGAIYFATERSVWRLISARPPNPGSR